MFKTLVIAENVARGKELAKKLTLNTGILTVDIVSVQELSQEFLQNRHELDLIVTDRDAMRELLLTKTNIVQPRQQIKAGTHQGIVMVPMQNINYFQAEHKYVVVYHLHGQLLIEDSLNSLAKEFADTFVRIHRKTLVAKHKIEMLNKDTAGKFYIKLRDSNEKLMVSRRQLAQVRKMLSCL